MTNNVDLRQRSHSDEGIEGLGVRAQSEEAGATGLLKELMGLCEGVQRMPSGLASDQARSTTNAVRTGQ
jgi:hypothetical protein